MFKLFGLLISIFLILIIFLRVPKESIGLSSFNGLLGSAGSAQHFLNILTICGIIIFFAIAIKLNRI